MISKIVTFLKSYLNINGEIDESILIITLVFLISIGVLVYYAFILKIDIPHNITHFMEFIWGGTVGMYVTKNLKGILKKQ